MIESLVSGDMNSEQYRETLLLLESHPERWRDCALAFLVEQALHRDLQALASGDVDWDDSQVSQADRPAVASVTAPAGANSVNLSSLERQHQKLQWMHRLTTVAALLLVSFTVGWFGAGLRGQAARQPARSDMGTGSVASHEPATMPPVPSPPSVDSQPMVDGQQLQYVGQQIIPSDGAPPPLLRKLQEERKIELESTTAFVPVYQGDSVILVPIHEYKVRPRAAF